MWCLHLRCVWNGYNHDLGANDKVARENRRVQEAERAAKAKIRSKNSNISEADFKINKSSTAVTAWRGQLEGHR